MRFARELSAPNVARQIPVARGSVTKWFAMIASLKDRNVCGAIKYKWRDPSGKWGMIPYVRVVIKIA